MVGPDKPRVGGTEMLMDFFPLKPVFISKMKNLAVSITK